MNQNKIYSIGEVSTICNIPIKTLRYYDDIKLIEPAKRDESSNYRYYCANQILQLFIVRKLKLLGFSLKEIKNLIAIPDMDALQNAIETKLFALKNHIELLQDQYAQGSFLLERLKKRHVVLNDTTTGAQEAFRIEDIPLVDVIFTRKIKPDYNNAGVSIERWVEILDIAAKHNLKTVGAITLTYHNEPLEQFYLSECDLEICLQVKPVLPLPIFKKYGGFKAVTAMHIGSHASIHNTHIGAIKWINKQNYKITGPISEEYIISPMDVNHEETYLSKIIIPIKR